MKDEDAATAEDVNKLAMLARDEMADAHDQWMERQRVLEGVLGGLVEHHGLRVQRDAVKDLLKGHEVAVGPAEVIHIVNTATNAAFKEVMTASISSEEVDAVEQAMRTGHPEHPTSERVIGAFLRARRERFNL